MCPVGSGSPFSYTVVSVQFVKSRDHEMSSLYLAMTSSHGRFAGIESGATNPVPRIWRGACDHVSVSDLSQPATVNRTARGVSSVF